jgi:flagellar basal-body rod modification protein FlgD
MADVTSSVATRGVSTQQTVNAFAESLTDQGDRGVGGLDDFLLLLTTQMKNQDPLNPQDSTEFVAQLANFSAVEPQINTNTNLETLIERISENNVQNLAGYIGLDITAEGAGFQYDNEPVEIDVPASDPTVKEASVEITNALGQLIAVIPAKTEGGKVTWNGKDTNDRTVDTGRYKATYVYKGADDAGEETVKRVEAEGNGRVVQARQEGDETILKLDSGAEVNAKKVTSVQI